MPVRSTLFEFWKEQELKQGRTITVTDVSKATGLHRDTINRLLENKTSRFDEPVVDALCRFFDVPSGHIPFLMYEKE